MSRTLPDPGSCSTDLSTGLSRSERCNERDRNARRGRDRARARDHAGPAGRLPDARSARRSALCRQGPLAQEAGRELHARGQPDQAPEAALQHRPARRQILSVADPVRGPHVSADQQASRHAGAPRRLLGPVRLGLGGEPDRDRHAARFSAPFLRRHRVRQPLAALPAAPDQALLGALRRPHRRGGLRQARRPGEGLPLRPRQHRAARARRRDGASVGEPGVRTRGLLARPHPRADPRPGQRRDQPREPRGRRRDRGAPSRRPDLHPGFFLSRRPQQRQPGLFSHPHPRRGGGRSAGRLHCPVLRRQDAAPAGALQPRPAGGGARGRGARHQGGPARGHPGAGTRRETRGGGARRDQRARGARTPARRECRPAQAPGRCGRDLRAPQRARTNRNLRQQPHHGHQRLRRDDRGRPGRLPEIRLPQIRDPRRHHPRR